MRKRRNCIDEKVFRGSYNREDKRTVSPVLHRVPCHARFDRCFRGSSATASAQKSVKFHLRWDFTHVSADATRSAGVAEQLPKNAEHSSGMDMGYTVSLRFRCELSGYAIRPRGTRTSGHPSSLRELSRPRDGVPRAASRAQRDLMKSETRSVSFHIV